MLLQGSKSSRNIAVLRINIHQHTKDAPHLRMLIICLAKLLCYMFRVACIAL